MNIVSPAMVLGKPVVDQQGAPVGSVLDVGVHDLGRVKFLLIGDTGEIERLRRVPVDEVDSIDRSNVILKKA